MDRDDRHIIQSRIDEVYRSESARALATLIRLLGDFDLAEDALQDAFAAASERWPVEGMPANPRAWLVSTGRFKAIDSLRRRARFSASLARIAEEIDSLVVDPCDLDDKELQDDQLRLIFTCCHPSLAREAQVALTLREVCGLTTDEIARAFLSPSATVAQRIVRAKAKIRTARIPYVIPVREDIPERLDAVLHVIYLVFNEGYAASSGESLVRRDLCREAIRLGRLLVDLLPDAEAIGLLALMLLHESRRAARTTPEGDVVLLEDQDRSLWNRSLIQSGVSLVERALATPGYGAFALQAAIAALHATAVTPSDTDWAEIAALYDLLFSLNPSPVVELNRAVAIAMRDGPTAGLVVIDAIHARGDLRDYFLSHSARAELCRRIGDLPAARQSYEKALALALTEPDRRFLERKLAEIS
jgi:RNA polymerase sigma-70 factor (ECF subfamily)